MNNELYKKINERFGTSYSSNKDINFGDFLYCDKIDIHFLDELVSHYSHYRKMYQTFLLSVFASKYKNLPYDFIEKHKDFLDWGCLCSYQKLSEDFIEKHLDYINWEKICVYQKLSEDFIERNFVNVHWDYICAYQKLSEEFIQANAENIDWSIISKTQVLSESFIDKFSKEVNWLYISEYQKLSEEFIEKHSSEVYWDYISECQKLSENFIEKHSSEVDWYNIAIYQKLSEEFIERHLSDLNIYSIQMYQKLSEEFIERHKSIINSSIAINNWLYKSAEWKKQKVIKTKKYECHDDYFIAYKAIRYDRYSLYNFQYKYEKGGVYESNCDCSSDEDSFGLNVGTEDFANGYGLSYSRYQLVRCKVKYEDIGRIVHNGDKIRCFKIEILD